MLLQPSPPTLGEMLASDATTSNLPERPRRLGVPSATSGMMNNTLSRTPQPKSRTLRASDISTYSRENSISSQTSQSRSSRTRRQFSGGGPELFTRAEELSDSLKRRQAANAGASSSNGGGSHLNHHGSSSSSSPPVIAYRPMTPQPRSRTLGLHDEVRIDQDLTPNFVFLNSGAKPMMAAQLPPPTPSPSLPKNGMNGVGGASTSSASSTSLSSQSTPTSTARSFSPNLRTRNLEIGSIHAYNGTGTVNAKGGLALEVHTPRRWEFSPAPPGAAAHAAAASNSHSHSHNNNNNGNLSPPRNANLASTSSNGMTVTLSPGGGAGGSGPFHPSPNASAHPHHLSQFDSTSNLGISGVGGGMRSPVLLGSGILGDVASTCGRVLESMCTIGKEGVVLADEEAILDLVSAHRFQFAKAAKHPDGAFVTQLLQRKYNSGVAGDGPDKADLLAGRTADAAAVLSAESMRIAVPFAPREWFFSLANLQLVISFHLVFCALDWGLSDSPPPPPLATMTLLPPTTDLAEAHAAAARADQEAASKAGPRAPYSSLDLARSLAAVARASPHAFDADRLSKMDAVRLGSWLQPDVFAEALRTHPELLEIDDENGRGGPMLSSPSSIERQIPFTFPGLAERARILREIGFGLLKNFGGSPWKLVEQAEHSASRLVDLLVQHFASFRDAAIYRGRFVFFYTRAQTFVTNIWIALHGTSLGSFNDLEDLTPRADRILPPVLQALGLLRYSREMRVFIEEQQDFAATLPAEVEIEVRCAAAHVVKRITQVLANLGINVMPVQMGQSTHTYTRITVTVST